MQAGVAFVLKAFQITNIDVWGGLASLSVRHRRADIDAWLRFQVHTSFGPLLTSERIFWMHAVRCGESATSAEPGRSQDRGEIPGLSRCLSSTTDGGSSTDRR
jgi:hypothetical protein